jgi:hypothetical protein
LSLKKALQIGNCVAIALSQKATVLAKNDKKKISGWARRWIRKRGQFGVSDTPTMSWPQKIEEPVS